jgi:hypothetical protein
VSDLGILKSAALKLDTSVISFFEDAADDCKAGAVAFPSELGRNLRRRASMGSSLFPLVEDARPDDAGFLSVLNSPPKFEPSFLVESS